MKANIRSRNIVINSYVGMFAVTIVGAFSVFFLLHIMYDTPLTAFASSDLYAFDTL